jgi:tripartite-type tricarboxylate transporter receptor subunit TctC
MLPGVPTISEAALPGYELTSWLGVFGPAGVPREIVQTLNTAIHKSMAAPDASKKLMAVGVDPEVSSPEQLAERLNAGQTRITKVIREAGIKLE